MVRNQIEWSVIRRKKVGRSLHSLVYYFSGKFYSNSAKIFSCLDFHILFQLQLTITETTCIKDNTTIFMRLFLELLVNNTFLKDFPLKYKLLRC